VTGARFAADEDVAEAGNIRSHLERCSGSSTILLEPQGLRARKINCIKAEGTGRRVTGAIPSTAPVWTYHW